MFKLKKINYFFNSNINYAKDSIIYNKKDYWANVYETIKENRADCEDYVFAKYQTLVKLGLKKDKFHFSVVKINGYENPHMVLLYEENKNDFLVLDNIGKKVLALSKRKDLKEIYRFNESILNNKDNENSITVMKKWKNIENSLI